MQLKLNMNYQQYVSKKCAIEVSQSYASYLRNMSILSRICIFLLCHWHHFFHICEHAHSQPIRDSHYVNINKSTWSFTTWISFYVVMVDPAFISCPFASFDKYFSLTLGRPKVILFVVIGWRIIQKLKEKEKIRKENLSSLWECWMVPQTMCRSTSTIKY